MEPHRLLAGVRGQHRRGEERSTTSPAGNGDRQALSLH
jgi:hypothetical protein